MYLLKINKLKEKHTERDKTRYTNTTKNYYVNIIQVQITWISKIIYFMNFSAIPLETLQKSVRPEIRGTTDFFYGGAYPPSKTSLTRRSSFFVADGRAETDSYNK